jgi:hypothetical protein
MLRFRTSELNEDDTAMVRACDEANSIVGQPVTCNGRRVGTVIEARVCSATVECGVEIDDPKLAAWIEDNLPGGWYTDE